jgi:hypothetical protein
MQERIARAAVERDTWRASRMQENYLEACSMVRQDTLPSFERS